MFRSLEETLVDETGVNFTIDKLSVLDSDHENIYYNTDYCWSSPPPVATTNKSRTNLWTTSSIHRTATELHVLPDLKLQLQRPPCQFAQLLPLP